uniref:Uncharacterized protein n=1 Tax=Rhizophora mucronata TaxID=61149 RepID=A0A2P2KXQ7_RHIMU
MFIHRHETFQHQVTCIALMSPEMHVTLKKQDALQFSFTFLVFPFLGFKYEHRYELKSHCRM